MDKYAHPNIDSIMKEPNNKSCFDCGASHPKWASINNGVFVCLNCAGIHRGFGVNISFIRSLTMDNWDERQLKFIKLGGNKRLKELLDEYNIPISTDIDLKYKLNAIHYYRQYLRAEVYGEALPEKPDLISGLERIDDGFKRNNNIDNSNFISYSNNELINTHSDDKKKGGFFGKLGGFIGKTATDLSVKIKDIKLAEKSKVLADKTVTWMDKKTKQVMQSQLVQNIVNKSKNVFAPKSQNDINIDDNFRNDNNIPMNNEENPDIFQIETSQHSIQDNNQNKDNNQNIEQFFLMNKEDKVEQKKPQTTENNIKNDFPFFTEPNGSDSTIFSINNNNNSKISDINDIFK